jgi:hypothetical protein
LAVNGKPITAIEGEHLGGYVSILSLRKGDHVTIFQPVARQVRREKVGGNNVGESFGGGYCDRREKVEYSITWLGHDVVDIHPRGQYLPFPV